VKASFRNCPGEQISREDDTGEIARIVSRDTCLTPVGWQNSIRTEISSYVRVMLGDRKIVDADLRASLA
jgi:hypothetical protein